MNFCNTLVLLFTFVLAGVNVGDIFQNVLWSLFLFSLMCVLFVIYCISRFYLLHRFVVLCRS